jgi:hypothetical protein
LSGAVNAAEADNPAIYRLTLPGKKGSYTAKNARAINLRLTVYGFADGTVTLMPTKPFALTRPVQLVIDGLPPSGFQHGSGRYIDGAHNGTPGSNTVAILSRGGASVEAVASGTGGGQNIGMMAVADALLDQGAFDGLMPGRRNRRERSR